MAIHPLALVHAKAEVASDVHIGPWTVIGPNVVIAKGCHIGPHVSIEGHTVLGEDNELRAYVSLGGKPQHREDHGRDTRLLIGDRNRFFEYSTVNRGTEVTGYTQIGNDCLLMVAAHVAHDCRLGDGVTMVNQATLGGHVRVGAAATLGAFSAIHQYCHIGAYSFLTRACIVVQDIIPYVLVAHNPACLYGINKVGLKRHQFSAQAIKGIERAYRIVRSSRSNASMIESLREIATEVPEAECILQHCLDTQRGCLRTASVSTEVPAD